VCVCVTRWLCKYEEYERVCVGEKDHMRERKSLLWRIVRVTVCDYEPTCVCVCVCVCVCACLASIEGPLVLN